MLKHIQINTQYLHKLFAIFHSLSDSQLKFFQCSQHVQKPTITSNPKKTNSFFHTIHLFDIIFLSTLLYHYIFVVYNKSKFTIEPYPKEKGLLTLNQYLYLNNQLHMHKVFLQMCIKHPHRYQSDSRDVLQL